MVDYARVMSQLTDEMDQGKKWGNEERAELENNNVEAGVVIHSSGNHQTIVRGFYNKTTEISKNKIT